MVTARTSRKIAAFILITCLLCNLTSWLTQCLIVRSFIPSTLAKNDIIICNIQQRLVHLYLLLFDVLINHTNRLIYFWINDFCNNDWKLNRKHVFTCLVSTLFWIDNDILCNQSFFFIIIISYFFICIWQSHWLNDWFSTYFSTLSSHCTDGIQQQGIAGIEEWRQD